MPFTNYWRAISVLKKGRFNINAIKNGDNGAVDINKDDVENVLNWDKYNIFASLNRAGILFKNSFWTRLTTHKVNDFAVIQSQSNTNCELYRQALRDLIRAQDSARVKFDELDEKVKKRILSGANRILDSAIKELKRAYNEAQKNENLKIQLEEFEKKSDQEKYEFLKKAFEKLQEKRVLSSNVVFTQRKAIEAPPTKSNTSHLINDQSLGGLLAGLVFVWTPTGILLLLGGELVAGAVMLGIFPGLPLLLAAAALVVCPIYDGVSAIRYYREATAPKRQLMKLNDNFSKAIRKLNECEKYLEYQLLREIQHCPPNAKVDISVINLTIKFLKDQEELWRKYKSASDRIYIKDGLHNIIDDKHGSGLRTVSDNKKSRSGYQRLIGTGKEALANTWCALPEKFDTCYKKYYKHEL